MDTTNEPFAEASAIAVLEKLARDFGPDVASCSCDTSDMSNDEVEPTTEESASKTDENTRLAQLSGCHVWCMRDDIMKHMKDLQKTLQEGVCMYQQHLISANSQIKRLSEENQRLHDKIRVLDMVMARYERRNEALINEKCDLQGKLEELAKASIGDTEPDITTESHKRDRGSQEAKQSDTGDRARKRAKRRTTSP
ncbi:hypothetical protein IFR05_005319 [Cadophora sp. M221]|nr:hypothetical protein IFR05_005319 [Cadophora sp. M221]